jgi:hypothetical protein
MAHSPHRVAVRYPPYQDGSAPDGLPDRAAYDRAHERSSGACPPGRALVKWVTREHVKVDRVACPWLIRKYIDRDAEFLFVPASEVDAVAEREGATPFDTEGVKLGHRDGKCSFETIIEEYGLLERDPALGPLADIVHGADVAADIDAVPESRGLKAIAEGFGLVHSDDHAILAAEFAVYDALHAWCSQRSASRTPTPGVV